MKGQAGLAGVRRGPVRYCTVVTKSHLAFARVLAHSLLECQPGAELWVLLADRTDGQIDSGAEPFRLIFLEDLADPDQIQQMCFYYTPAELCFALRAWLHEYMLEKTNSQAWVYLDTDILVCHPLDALLRQLEASTLLLSPHTISVHLSGVDLRSVCKLESCLLHTGIYNGGFLGVRRTAESRAFIGWFKRRLQYYAFDLRPAQYGDQLWLNLVPSIFPGVGTVRHPGANVAYWNLFERTISEDRNGSLRVGDEPLLFFHFAGFEPDRPQRLTKYGFPPSLERFPPEIRKLAIRYRELLVERGYEQTRNLPYAFGRFTTGEVITADMRRLYFEAVFRGHDPVSNPFDNYPYFQARLRQQRLKRWLAQLGRKLVRRVRRSLRTDYDLESPSWS